MNARTLVIVGHPDLQSFGGALAQAYANGARAAGAEVDLLHLGAASFDATPSGRRGRWSPTFSWRASAS